jgi:hypothetical protein
VARLKARTLILPGVAALFGAAMSAGFAQAVPTTMGAVSKPTQPVQPAVFGHHRHIEAYCYPRNYWWFYRPYTTADEGYARCMPYFHYLPQAYDRRRGYAPPK